MEKRYKIVYCTPSLYMAGGVELVKNMYHAIIMYITENCRLCSVNACL